MHTLKYYFKYLCLVTCFFSSTDGSQLISQCTGRNSINLSQFTLYQLEREFSEMDISELSGMTYVDGNGFVLISDNDDDNLGKIASFDDNDVLEVFTVIDVAFPGCMDFESITYIDADENNPDIYRFAFSEEKQRKVVLLSLNLTGSTTINYPSSSDIINLDVIGTPVNGCGNNSGIEGLAYSPESGLMYLGLESGDLYYFDLINDDSDPLSPTEFIDLDDIGLVDYCTFSGMDVLPNGNLVLLTTYKLGCSGDSGGFDRKLIEVDPCGCVISQLDLNTVVEFGNPSQDLDNIELEGVAYREGDLYIVGEEGVMYSLKRNTNVPVLNVNQPAAESELIVQSGIEVNWTTSPSLNQGQIVIELFNENTNIQTLTINPTADDGSFITELPSDLIAPPGPSYRIKVTNTANQTVTGFSGYFDIITPPVCLDNLDINDDAGATDNQEAEFTITADNMISSSSNAIYHAGEEVLLTDGFVALAGSTFRAYIEGCSDTFEEFQVGNKTNETHE